MKQAKSFGERSGVCLQRTFSSYALQIGLKHYLRKGMQTKPSRSILRAMQGYAWKLSILRDEITWHSIVTVWFSVLPSLLKISLIWYGVIAAWLISLDPKRYSQQHSSLSPLQKISKFSLLLTQPLQNPSKWLGLLWAKFASFLMLQQRCALNNWEWYQIHTFKIHLTNRELRLNKVSRKTVNNP